MSQAPPVRKDWLAHYTDLIGKWRGRGGEDQEDAMHDTVLGMLEGGVATIYDPRAYMSRGTSNRLISWYRHVSTLEMTPLDTMDPRDHPAGNSADEGVRLKQLADELAGALEDLPLKCRQVYIRCRLEGCTHTEIAHEMDLSRSMVEKYMTRAVRHINDRLHHHAP